MSDFSPPPSSLAAAGGILEIAGAIGVPGAGFSDRGGLEVTPELEDVRRRWVDEVGVADVGAEGDEGAGTISTTSVRIAILVQRR